MTMLELLIWSHYRREYEMKMMREAYEKMPRILEDYKRKVRANLSNNQLKMLGLPKRRKGV